MLYLPIFDVFVYLCRLMGCNLLLPFILMPTLSLWPVEPRQAGVCVSSVPPPFFGLLLPLWHEKISRPPREHPLPQTRTQPSLRGPGSPRWNSGFGNKVAGFARTFCLLRDTVWDVCLSVPCHLLTLWDYGDSMPIPTPATVRDSTPVVLIIFTFSAPP